MPVISVPGFKISTQSFGRAVRDVLLTEARAAAGKDGKVSKKDAAKLGPFLQDAYAELVAAGVRAPGAQRLALNAALKANDAIAGVNQEEGKRGAETISLKELRLAGKNDPGLRRVLDSARGIAEQEAYRDWGYATFGDAFIDE